MKYVREESIRCVCGWAGIGFGGDPCPRCGSKERISMNKETPEDEMILAELIAVASAHGLRSCRGGWFRDQIGRQLGIDDDGWPPRDAVACCAKGASFLLSPIPHLPGVTSGNDALEHETPPYYVDDPALSGWNIGAAFEIAMRHG